MQLLSNKRQKAIILAAIAILLVSIMWWVKASLLKPDWCHRGHPIATDQSLFDQKVVDRIDVSSLDETVRRLYEAVLSGTAIGSDSALYSESLLKASRAEQEGSPTTCYTFWLGNAVPPKAFDDIYQHSPQMNVFVCSKCSQIVEVYVCDSKF